MIMIKIKCRINNISKNEKKLKEITKGIKMVFNTFWNCEVILKMASSRTGQIEKILFNICMDGRRIFSNDIL
mgnify:CR=1 FL=1